MFELNIWRLNMSDYTKLKEAIDEMAQPQTVIFGATATVEFSSNSTSDYVIAFGSNVIIKSNAKFKLLIVIGGELSIEDQVSAGKVIAFPESVKQADGSSKRVHSTTELINCLEWLIEHGNAFPGYFSAIEYLNRLKLAMMPKTQIVVLVGMLCRQLAGHTSKELSEIINQRGRSHAEIVGKTIAEIAKVTDYDTLDIDTYNRVRDILGKIDLGFEHRSW